MHKIDEHEHCLPDTSDEWEVEAKGDVHTMSEVNEKKANEDWWSVDRSWPSSSTPAQPRHHLNWSASARKYVLSYFIFLFIFVFILLTWHVIFQSTLCDRSGGSRRATSISNFCVFKLVVETQGSETGSTVICINFLQRRHCNYQKSCRFIHLTMSVCIFD